MDCVSQPGKTWFDDEEIEFPHDIIGRKLKLVVDI